MSQNRADDEPLGEVSDDVSPSSHSPVVRNATRDFTRDDEARAGQPPVPHHGRAMSAAELADAQDTFRRAKALAKGLQHGECLEALLGLNGELAGADDEQLHIIIEEKLSPPEQLLLSALYLQGVCEGKLERHAAAVQTGRRLAARFPNQREGHYLLGVSLQATGALVDAIAALRKTMAMSKGDGDAGDDGGLYKGLQERVQVAALALKQKLYVDKIQEHGRRFATCRPLRCRACDHAFDHPTPEWLCPRCFPKKFVHVWQPDGAAACACCAKAVGRFGRHHCRCCGHLVCGACSSKKGTVPALGFKEEVRVCDKCRSTAAEVERAAAQRQDARAAATLYEDK
jgi:hypothetical protein